MSVNAVPVSGSDAPSVVERWYVLIVMCLVYAINIAARYVVSTGVDNFAARCAQC